MISLHIYTSILAIVSGLIVLLSTKGTLVHLIVGRIYALAMVTLAVASFGIYEVTGSFYIFHAISIQSLIFVIAAVVIARFMRTTLSNWQAWHGRFMVYSYITLIVTGTAQFFDRLPIANTTLRALVFLTLPAVLGWAYFEFYYLKKQPNTDT